MALGARAEAGLRPPVVGQWRGTATLVGDPSNAFGGVRVDVRILGKRVEAQARGGAAARLRSRLAGEQVALAGELRPVPASARAYSFRRHVAAQLIVSEVGGWELGNGPSRLANSIRRTLLAGVESLPPERRALYAGFVLGDDRDQSVEITDDFRAAGLTHLLVVSGQNVAFVLALLSPLLSRLRLGARLTAGLVLLLLFGVLTRWEPSVLRAEAMAGLALLSSTMGRPVSGLRILALAVTGLLLLDPLLVGSLGFLLSVGASGGILLLSRPIAALLPGPRPLADALGVTLAAQVGVAPVLVPVFDGLPVASLPANLLAVPVAGPLDDVGHRRRAAGGDRGWPLGPDRPRSDRDPGGVGGRGRPLGGGAAAGPGPSPAPAGPRRSSRSARSSPAARAGTAPSGFWPAPRWRCWWCRRWPPAGPRRSTGGRWCRASTSGAGGGTTVLVVDGSTTTTGRLMSALHNLDVRRLDVVVMARPGVAAARWIEPVLRRFPAGVLLAPPGHRLAGAVVPAVGSRLVTGALTVEIDAVAPRLAVRVRRGPAVRRH